MDIVSSAVLGLVQGVTEFLPVSSTGHLVLTHALLGVENSSSLAFDAVLQLATALAVIVYYFDEIYVLVQTVLRKLGRMPVNEKDYVMAKAIAIGTIPAVVMGLLLESYMESLFRHPVLVAAVLIAGSLFFIYAEYVYENDFHTGEIDVKMGWRVGLFQVLALIPGFSRSGATIGGGMILGLDRSNAARFSFLLGLPVIVGSGLKMLLELISSGEDVAWFSVFVGSIVAFVVGLISIRFLLSFIRKHSLWPFIWYRIALACFVLFVTFFG